MYEFTHRIPHQAWEKPSRNEDAWFRRQELERRLARLRERRRARREARRRELRSRVRGHCPECGSRLRHIRVREGEADQCVGCQGVFMDRALFETLTHPEDSHLTRVLRSVVLQYSLGRLNPQHRTPQADA